MTRTIRAKVSKARRKYKLKPGSYGYGIKDPSLEIIDKGRLAYLWIGGSLGPCVGTLSGPKTLRKLAKAILEAVGDD